MGNSFTNTNWPDGVMDHIHPRWLLFQSQNVTNMWRRLDGGAKRVKENSGRTAAREVGNDKETL